MPSTQEFVEPFDSAFGAIVSLTFNVCQRTSKYWRTSLAKFPLPTTMVFSSFWRAKNAAAKLTDTSAEALVKVGLRFFLFFQCFHLSNIPRAQRRCCEYRNDNQQRNPARNVKKINDQHLDTNKAKNGCQTWF
jgi:hypothetical protein